MRQAVRCILASIAVCVPADADAKTELLKTQPGSVVHWGQPSIAVGVDASAGSRTVAPEDVLAALRRATETWNAVDADQPKLRPTTDGQPDVVVRFCRERWQGENIDLGKSRFTASLHDGTVTAATVEINECDHSFARAGGPGGGPGYNLEAVLAHELGHVLGLGHSDNRTAIMYPTGGGPHVRTPHVEDQTTLALIYFGRPAMRLAGARGSSGAGEAPVAASLHSALALPADGPAMSSVQPGRDPTLAANRKITGARNVLVYTGEPTLLPPIEIAAEPRDKRLRGGRHPKAAPAN